MTAAGIDTLVAELDSAGNLPAGLGPLLHAVRREWFVPGRLWDEAEAAYRWWIGQGKLVGPDWVWTITPHHQTIALAGD